MSTVLEDPRLVPQVDNKSTYYNEKTGETYFKVFLLNNKVNKRKFKLSNLQQLHRDVDGYENLPLTFVKEGMRKGNHPNPKDANIFEANYQNKYTYVTKAIEYYRTFGVAKLVKVFKPDPNLLTASNDPILNYHVLCSTKNPVMLELLASAERENKEIYVSPAMLSWDWVKDPQTGIVSVNSFVPTHLAIVDSPAYDPELAYIKKQTCQKDGMSCYYELFEASDIENLNNNNQQSNDMSTNKFPSTIEEYVKSHWSMDVVDTKNVNAEDLVKNMGNYIIIDKSKVDKNNVTPNQQGTGTPIPNNKPNEIKQETTTTVTEESKPAGTNKQEEIRKETTSKKEESNKSSFTLEDVKALLQEQKDSILKEIKAEQTKGERETLLDTYIQNDKIKAVKEKIDADKLKQTRDLFNSLPLDNAQLKTILDNTIYNPKVANPDVYTSILAISEQNREIDQKDLDKKNDTPKPPGAPQNPTIPKANTSTKPITDIPAKPNANINMFGTEFKNSADSSNKYNDDYKQGKNFNASKSDNEYRPKPTTGEGTPKRFQKYIQ